MPSMDSLRVASFVLVALIFLWVAVLPTQSHVNWSDPTRFLFSLEGVLFSASVLLAVFFAAVAAHDALERPPATILFAFGFLGSILGLAWSVNALLQYLPFFPNVQLSTLVAPAALLVFTFFSTLWTTARVIARNA